MSSDSVTKLSLTWPVTDPQAATKPEGSRTESTGTKTKEVTGSVFQVLVSTPRRSGTLIQVNVSGQPKIRRSPTIVIKAPSQTLAPPDGDTATTPNSTTTPPVTPVKDIRYMNLPRVADKWGWLPHSRTIPDFTDAVQQSFSASKTMNTPRSPSSPLSDGETEEVLSNVTNTTIQ
jgi:hypothetical protein